MDEDKIAMELAEDDMESSFQKTFGWYIILNRVADNDFTKHDHIYEKTIMQVLNQMSFLISHDKEMARLQKEAMKKN